VTTLLNFSYKVLYLV